jgi:hypothetical protein
MDALFLDSVLQKVFGAFSIVYVDFNAEEYQPYQERRIGGFVRFDERKIIFDRWLKSHLRGPRGLERLLLLACGDHQAR